jgi:Tat protein translocase TatB subunit
MGNLGGGEVLVIMLVALLVLGPSKLPDAARQLGKAVAEFRKVSGGFQRELRAALEAEPEPTPAAQVPSGLPVNEQVQADAQPVDAVQLEVEVQPEARAASDGAGSEARAASDGAGSQVKVETPAADDTNPTS